MAKKSVTVPPPLISDAEWLVMEQFWHLGSATSKKIHQSLKDSQGWKPTTVQTLINRLVQKGALVHEKQGREFIFSPCVRREDCTHAVSRSLVDKIFGGRLAPLLACFLEREECTAEEIAELKQMLKEREGRS